MSLLDTDRDAAPALAPSPFVTMAVVAMILSALALMWSFVDTRTVGDAAVWVKPLKFAVSFVVLFATIALIERGLSDRVRTGWTMQIIAWIMGAAFLSEMAYMMYQAARAEASHFNLTTPFHEFMYVTVMGGGAFALVACIAAVGWIARRDEGATFGPATRQAVWLGCALSFGLTLIVAGYLSNLTGHHVGLHPAGAPTLPFVGWSGATGDLRPAHFLSLHAMQVLPLLGLWLDRRNKPGGVRAIRLVALAYATITGAVFVQALMGLPLIPLA